MPCYDPIPIKSIRKKNDDYLVNFVPCGKCIGCLQRRRDSWSIRVYEESKLHSLCTFLTLTYNDDHVPLKILEYNEETKWYIHDTESYIYLPLVKSDLQKYFKRVRSVQPGLRYFACGEYGSHNRRPHYHGIVFGVDRDILVDKWSDINGDPLGFVQCADVTMESIHYVTKYMTNQEESKFYYPGVTAKPFQIMSKGLGQNYVDDTKDYHISGTHNHYTSPGGVRHSLPRFYGDRIFSKEEKRKLGEKAISEALAKMEKDSESDPFIHVKRIKAKVYKSSQTSKSKKL